MILIRPAAAVLTYIGKTCYVAKNIVSFVSEEPVITAISSKVAEAEKADNDNIYNRTKPTKKKDFSSSSVFPIHHKRLNYSGFPPMADSTDCP